jgi:methylated-DNA-protein-cysteine methyltransferase-like protein
MAGQKRDEGGGVKPRPEEHAAADDAGYRERVFEIVRRIPAGRVMTYGQLAVLLGEGYTARTVGYVMHAADDSVPWQRVINAQGACSTGRVVLPPDLQQRMLESEGVAFDARGRCDLARLRWTPEEYAAADDDDDEAQPSLFGD